MCEFITWFHDEKVGYIIECEQCNRIKLAFGNFLFSFNDEEFDQFVAYISKRAGKLLAEKADMCTRNQVLPGGNSLLSILLSGSELLGLHKMVDYADTERRCVAMKKLFER